MKTYLASNDVVETIILDDDDGVPYAATGVTYRVYDENDVNVVSTTPVTLVDGALDVAITVGASSNELPIGQVRGLRTIELLIETASGMFGKRVSYVVLNGEVVVKGENSYQTFSEALLGAMDLPGLVAWQDATRDERVAALVDSHSRLAKLRFSIKYDNGQTRLGGATEIADIRNLSLEEFLALPLEFISSLQKAQIVEADTALGGDPIDEQRRGGLMSSTVGEVSQMYRSGTPLILPVSERALRHLTGYVKFGIGVGRS